jgi:16S rRNA C967 or C1407 C5-methylase (RsmB/RsmF family)
METAEVVKAFEERLPHFERQAVHNPLVPGSPPQEMLLLWPQETGGHGMFLVAWIRGSC